MFENVVDKETIGEIYMECNKDVQLSINKIRKIFNLENEDEKFETENYLSTKDTKFVVEEIVGDLFKCDDKSSMAHCVSKDLKMSKGIAVLFVRKFGKVKELELQNKGIFFT